MVKALKKIHYEGRIWFFDERLRQIRDVTNPHNFQNLNDFEIEYFRKKKGVVMNTRLQDKLKKELLKNLTSGQKEL